MNNLDVVTRSRELGIGPEARPVEIPGDFATRPEPVLSGCIELPGWIYWSEPRLLFDMSQQHDRLKMFTQVLLEGGPADISEFVCLSEIVEHWSSLILPRYIREVWDTWFSENEITTK